MSEGDRELHYVELRYKIYVGAKERQRRNHVAGDLPGSLGKTGTMKGDEVNVRDSGGTD